MYVYINKNGISGKVVELAKNYKNLLNNIKMTNCLSYLTFKINQWYMLKHARGSGGTCPNLPEGRGYMPKHARG